MHGTLVQRVLGPRWLGVLTAAWLAASPLSAQVGTVMGRVLSRQDNRPLGNVQLTVQGTIIRALSDAEGRFTLTGVPIGQRIIVANLIGFAPERATAMVSPAEAATVQFTLSPSAVALEGIVVTGTAMGQERRSVANSISAISVADIDGAQAMSLEGILQGRVPGVTVTGTPAQAGGGARMVLRGINSLVGRNDPLVYVDGVRMSSGVLEGGMTDAGDFATFLGDIDAADIDRIEVVKGAAASTLYGVEAAAGVIQIFTKRGQIGDTRWTVNVEQGLASVGHVGPKSDPTGLGINDCRLLITSERATRNYVDTVAVNPTCPANGSWLRNAHSQEYQMSVSGGTAATTYYLSSSFGRQQGVIPTQGQDNLNLRGNFTFRPRGNLSIQGSTMYTQREIGWVSNGDDNDGLMYNLARRNLGSTPDTACVSVAPTAGLSLLCQNDAKVFDMELEQSIQHFIAGATIEWAPSSRFRHRLAVGLDQSNSTFIRERPWQFYDFPEGSRAVDIENFQVFTADYAGSWNTTLGANLTSALSFGGQLYQNRGLGLRVDADSFAGPGDKIVQSAATFFGQEDRDVVRNGGWFVQEMIGWKDRLFFTAGLRGDQHSSFGTDLDLDVKFALYPKLGLTYTLSDHDFWPDWWETMRLRTAYGQTGEPPSQDASVRYWQFAGADEGKVGYIIFNQGNPAVGPERQREIEGGADGSLFNGRLNFTFTYFDQKTFDGLVTIDPPPSNGIAETIETNVGEWRVWGFESALDLNVLDSRKLRWDVRANYQKTNTKMLGFGLEADQEWNLDYANCHRVGYPMPGICDTRILNGDSLGQLPVYDSTNSYFGPTYPPNEWSLGTTISLFNRLTLDLFGFGQFGHVALDDMAQELADDALWPPCEEMNLRIREATALGGTAVRDSLGDLTAAQIGQCSDQFADNRDWVFPAAFFRFSSASLTFRLPDSWLPFGMRSGELQLRAGNLGIITNFPGVSPDNFVAGANILARGAGWILPPPRTWTVRARMNF